MDTDNAEALFISCTALPALEIIQELENKIKKIVLSSNQDFNLGFNTINWI